LLTHSGCFGAAIRIGCELSLHAIREVAVRMDGKPTQAIARTDVSVQILTDAELLVVAGGRIARSARRGALSRNQL
jgi:hypothetical protein